MHCLPASLWNKAYPDKHKYGGEGVDARFIGHPTGFFFSFSPRQGRHGFQLLEYVCGSTILGIVCDTAKNP